MPKPEDEGKTIFEHLGFGASKAGEISTVGDAMGEMMKVAKAAAVFIIIGFILGTIIDVFIGTSMYGVILALFMALMFVLKFGGKYIRDLRK